MNDDNLGLIKKEITFFMDKMFQFTFVYVGAVIAMVAGTKAEFIKTIASQLKIEPTMFVITAILLINLLYFILVASWSFAIINRGYFILTYRDEDRNDVLIIWEIFVRRSERGFGRINWNIDNYYILISMAVVLLSSALLFYLGFQGSTGTVWTKVGLVFILILHATPSWILTQT